MSQEGICKWLIMIEANNISEYMERQKFGTDSTAIYEALNCYFFTFGVNKASQNFIPEISSWIYFYAR